MTPRLKSRVRNHSTIVLSTALLLFSFLSLFDSPDQKYSWSMATGYTSIILLGITLVIGPLNVIKGKNNPVSTDLRRDIGIWCGVIGLAHVIVGIQVHMGNIWLYFVKALEGSDKYVLRSDLFGAANYTGLLAAFVLLLLLLLSNDLSLRILRPGKWKNLQRWSYAGFTLTLTHCIMYQVIEKRSIGMVLLFAIIMIAPIIFQLVGFSRFKVRP